MKNPKFHTQPPHFEGPDFSLGHAVACWVECMRRFAKTGRLIWLRRANVIQHGIEQDVDWRHGNPVPGEIDRLVAEIKSWEINGRS